MKTKIIEKIYDRGYSAMLNKYFIIARFNEFGETKYDRLFFADEASVNKVKEGDML